jgi:hypothetical protein
MVDDSHDMVAFLGVAADPRLLDEDLFNLPATEQYREPAAGPQRHDRLVLAGSLLTGASLLGGAALALYGGWQLLLDGGGVFDAVLAVIGLVLAGTHWGWVHVAEYIGLTIDEHHQRASDELRQDWLAGIQPYPRFSIATSVLDDASTRVQRVLHRPVLTARQTFTFDRQTDAEMTYDADTPAEVIASTVETMRRQARLETERLAARWEAAFSAYTAVLLSDDDERQRLIAQRAAATALSEHINASLLEPPLVE